MDRKKVIGMSRITLFLVLLALVIAGHVPAQEAKKDDPSQLLQQADQFYNGGKWADALKIYDTLLSKHASSTAVSKAAVDIKKKKAECETKLGIITDIAQAFKGKASLAKDGKARVLTVTYDFESDDQLKDFIPRDVDIKIEDGQLVAVSKESTSLLNVQGALFTKKVTIECTYTVCSSSGGGRGNDVGFAVFFENALLRGYWFCLGYSEFSNSTDMVNAILKFTEKDRTAQSIKQTGKPAMQYDKPYAVKIDVKNGKMEFWVDKKKILEDKDEEFSQGLIGWLFGQTGAKIKIDNLKIVGQASEEWLGKMLSESTSEALSADELDATVGEEGKDGSTWITVERVSAEDPRVIAMMPEKAQDLISNAREILANLPNLPTKQARNADRRRAIEIYDQAAKQAPTYPLPHYEKASLYEDLQDWGKALECINKALEVDPKFGEAHTMKGKILQKMNRLEHALECMNKGVELAPKYSTGYSSRAFVHLLLDNSELANADIETALKMKKDNDEALTYRRVIKGPNWPVSYSKETEHYRIRTDISQQLCDHYAECLETIFGYYLKMFPNDDKPKRKGRVYIFNTRKAFEIHAKLTSGNSDLSNVLGYFSPTFKEIYLFEDAAKQEETKKVLFHEGFHQFAHNYAEDIPPWFNEGCAEWFFGCSVKKKAVDKKGEILTGLSVLQDKLEKGAIRPLKDLMMMSQEEFMDDKDPAFNYVHSWSFVHFCFLNQKGKYAGLLADYYRALR